MLTRSNGKKNADALKVLLPPFKATALPNRSITGEPLEPPFVPDAAYSPKISKLVLKYSDKQCIIIISKDLEQNNDKVFLLHMSTECITSPSPISLLPLITILMCQNLCDSILASVQSIVNRFSIVY